MAVRYGVQRPNTYFAVMWEGQQSIDEVKALFNHQLDAYLLLNPNDENDPTLYYGMSIEDSQQFLPGTLIMNMGGFASLTEEQWDSSFQTVDTDGPFGYTLVDES